ncbi:hypothetical protein LCGC14_1441650 [marine sediment metagenome]|uniref:N-acetyltransferase domain-containing protein n=1 Tax=marine sediment metagenome TaxID=412755 RepID=A0A0F9MMD7_9ZZZZ
MIKKFEAKDMIQIIETGVKELGIKAQGTEELWELAREREKNGMCLTGVVNGEIVACGGIDLMWTGVGEVWLMLTPETDKYPIGTYEIIRDGLDKIIKDNKLHRVQAYGRIGFDRAHTLFKHLNFKPEGIARKYTPDKADCISYAKVS